MSKLISSNYIQPTAQKELNGELGLTSSDIAKSLGVDHHKVKEKIERNKWRGESEDIGFALSGDKEYVLDFFSAFMFVARWNNRDGILYFKFIDDTLKNMSKDQHKRIIDFGVTHKYLFHNGPKYQSKLDSCLYLIVGEKYCKFGVSALENFNLRVTDLKRYYQNILKDEIKEIFTTDETKSFGEYFKLEQKVQWQTPSIHKNEWYSNKDVILKNQLIPKMSLFT